MSEFEPSVFERVVSSQHDRSGAETDVKVRMVLAGLPVVFEPTEKKANLDLVDEENHQATPTIGVESCKSNPHPALNAADVRRALRQNGRR